MENASVVRNIFEGLGKWFWSERVWLPPNVTWKDVTNREHACYAQSDDLYYAFPVAFALLFLRFSLERYVFVPIGCYYGLRPARCSKAVSNPVLENAFQSNGLIGYKHIRGIAKQVEWTERKVERWLRQRGLQERPSTLYKFTESAWQFMAKEKEKFGKNRTIQAILTTSLQAITWLIVLLIIGSINMLPYLRWRFTFYSTTFVYGIYILYDKPWFWDSKFYWENYPYHSVTKEVWWYYMIQLGFYWSLSFSQFVDTKRKDFMQMFIHHIVSILLLSLSWICNLTRIGTFVIVIHDFADCPLEAAKMAKYIKKQRAADVLFVVFTLSWIVSRLGLYPYRVIYSTAFESLNIVPVFPAYFIFNGLLCALQVLHIIWTWAIIQIAIQAITSKAVSDIRSDESSDDSDDEKSDKRSTVQNKKKAS